MRSWFGEQLDLFAGSSALETNSPRAIELALTTTASPQGQPPELSATQPPVYDAKLYRRADLDTDEGIT